MMFNVLKAGYCLIYFLFFKIRQAGPIIYHPIHGPAQVQVLAGPKKHWFLFYTRLLGHSDLALNPGNCYCAINICSDLKAFVEVNTVPSSTFTLEARCPQGSTLGPKVFNIYCNDLFDHIKDAFILSYSDDSYIVVEADTLTNLKLKTEKVINAHINWLKET